uniref:Uncharacterized protein n=1 Tax=viral metagenome TaxID=1070528 RepID=A0A6M3K524_9ZZZZ
MKLYYEASEVPDIPMEDSEFIRVDITDMTDTEKTDILKAIKDVMSGKEYKLIEHTCYHDNIPKNAQCVMREI